MNKEQLRAYMVCQKKLHYDSRLYESEMLMEKLEHTTIFQESQIILLYHPLPDEVDTRSLIHKWWKTKTILLPKVSGNNLTLHIYKGTDSVAKGAYGIMEPTTPPFPINNMIDLAVIPGVAFDRRGNRLGRGKGYYDRLLCKFEGKGPYKIGLAFSYQVVDLVPTIETDIKMDVVIF